MKLLLRSDCPFTPTTTPSTEALPLIIIPLITAVAKPVVEKSLDALIEYLKRQKEAYTATAEAKAAGDFYAAKDMKSVNPNYGCLVVVRGKFGSKIISE